MDAINNKKIVVIYYAGDETINKGERTIECCVYGTSKAGNPVIRAYQKAGVTDTEQPGWKFFRVDRIQNWKETDDNFYAPRMDFNPRGDKSMTEIYGITKFK
jgi:predicted DNA-binding transcriptional regulator YafY